MGFYHSKVLYCENYFKKIKINKMRNNQIFLMAIFLVVAQFTFAQTKEEIIANYIENTGGAEAWNNLQGLKMTAKVSQGGMEIPIEMVQLKDGRQMTKITFKERRLSKAFLTVKNYGHIIS